MSALISIIIPIYKSEKYLKRCLDSVISQTHSNIQIILVDDGSPDKCPDICDEYAKNDSRIFVIHQKNSGVSSARNAGIEAAKGEYIVFIDSDDYVDNSLMEYGLKSICENNMDLFLCGLVIETFYDEKIIDTTKYVGFNENYFVRDFLNDLHTKFPYTLICSPCAKLYKTNIINNNRIRFDRSVSLGEDTLFNIAYLRFCSTVISTDRLLYHYTRGKEDALHKKYTPNLFDIHCATYEKWLDLYHFASADDGAIYRLNILFGNFFIDAMVNAINNKNNNDRQYRINLCKKTSEYIRRNMPKKIDELDNFKKCLYAVLNIKTILASYYLLLAAVYSSRLVARLRIIFTEKDYYI